MSIPLTSFSQLEEPAHEIVSIGTQVTDEEATLKIRDVFSRMSQGMYNKKVLLRLE